MSTDREQIMGTAFTTRTKSIKQSDEMTARYAFLRALAAKEQAERVQQTRIKLAFERLCRDYPMLSKSRLWAMAHSSIRMAAGTVHAVYREQRFMAS